jgi:hypothetical protein
MWAQLGMAALSSLQDEQNRKRDIASNVITQKYSPWTGANANFSQQGKNKTISNLIAGYGSGSLQDKLDAKDAADKIAAETAKTDAINREDAEYYAKLSKDPASVGAYPIGNKSAFASAAGAARGPSAIASGPDRGPAVDMGGNQAPSSSQLPGFMQGQNPWLSMASQPAPQRPALMSEFHQDAKRYNPPGAAWFNSTPLMRGY